MIRLTIALFVFTMVCPFIAQAAGGMATEALVRWRTTQELTAGEAAKAMDMAEGRYVQLEAGALPTEEEAAVIERVAAVPSPWWGGFAESVPDTLPPLPPPPRVLPPDADRVSCRPSTPTSKCPTPPRPSPLPSRPRSR